MGKVIGLTYDLKTDWVVDDAEPKDANAEFDKPETRSASRRTSSFDARRRLP